MFNSTIQSENYPIMPVDYILGNALIERYANYSTTGGFSGGEFNFLRFAILFIAFMFNVFVLSTVPIETFLCAENICSTNIVTFLVFTFASLIISCCSYILFLVYSEFIAYWNPFKLVVIQQMFELSGIFHCFQTNVHVNLFEKHLKLTIPKDYPVFNFPRVAMFLTFFFNPFINLRWFNFPIFACFRIVCWLFPSMLTVINLSILLKNVRSERSHITSTGILTGYGGIHFLIASIMDLIGRIFLVTIFVTDNLGFAYVVENGSFMDYGLKFAIIDSLLAMIYIPTIHFISFKRFRAELRNAFRQCKASVTYYFWK